MAPPTVTATTSVDAPPEVVFAILADPRQHSRIDGSGTVRGSVAGPDRLSLGAEFGMQMKNGAAYKIQNTVVEFEPDRLIAWRHKGLHRWRYELVPTNGGGTQVTETWDLSAYPGLVARAFHAVWGAKTQRAIEATLVNLKTAAEQDVTPRTP